MDLKPLPVPIYLINGQYFQSCAFFIQEPISYCITHFIWYYPIWQSLLVLVWFISTCITYHCANNCPVSRSPMMNSFSLEAFICFQKYSHLCLVVVGFMHSTDLIYVFFLNFVVMFILGLYLRFAVIFLVIILNYFLFCSCL